MNKKTLGKKLGVIAVLGLIIVLQSTDAFAYDRSRGNDRQRPREVIKVEHSRSYQSGKFLKPSWLWFSLALLRPSVRTVVTVPASGYVVVRKPPENCRIASMHNLPGERVEINILNSNGSHTTVTLVKQRGGYIGPQGEYYPGNPSVEQLRSLYGR